MKAVRLNEVRDLKKEKSARDVRGRLFNGVRLLLGELDQNLAGYAIVAWDNTGRLRSIYEAINGPIGPNLVPTLCADALNRHIASDMDRPADLGEAD
jgi:hypothetical protein